MQTWSEIPDIELYSDGGAEPNPGKGGFGVILSYKGRRKEFYQGYKLTTNNRMELMGVIVGLEKLKTKSNVRVFTDSQYVINGITKGWAVKWKENNWFRKKNEKALNSDLWDRLLNEVAKHNVQFNWVKGHSGHPENERCDTLATLALSSNELIEDTGFNLEETTTNGIEATSIPKKSKVKIQNEGDLCRNCGIPVIKKSPSKRKIKPNQEYYYEYYLYCPSCKNMYMIDEAKRFIS